MNFESADPCALSDSSVDRMTMSNILSAEKTQDQNDYYIINNNQVPKTQTTNMPQPNVGIAATKHPISSSNYISDNERKKYE